MPRLTRRDFVNTSATTLAAGSVVGSGALSAAEAPATDYPPAKTGMRGSHDGSYELFHEMSWRGDTRWPRPSQRSDDLYDLVIVGGGLSGLSSAYYYLEARPEARVLVLENHDDFGGHARRVEFDVGGRTVLTFGGSTSITFPDLFNARGLAMLADIGIDWQKFEPAERYDESWYERHAVYREGLFFNKAAHGVDLLMDDPAGAAAAYFPADRLKPLIDAMPLSEAGRTRLFEVMTDEPEIFPGLARDEKLGRLAEMSYESYLREELKMPEDVIAHLRDAISVLLAGVGWDGLPADVAAAVSMPGLRALDVKQPLSAIPLSRTGQGFIYTYPDGNATLARALVRKLIPQVAPGVPQTDEAIVDARFRYDELDRPGRRARIRLNATVTNVEHSADRGHVDVTYVVDLSTIEANTRFLERYVAEHDRLDYALLNAMVYTPKTSMTDDDIETSFAVGTLSRYLFTVKLSHLLAKARGARLSYMTMVSGLPDRVDIASVTKPGLHIFKAELQAFLSHSLMTYFFRREGLTSVAVEEQDPGIVQTRQVPLHPWWFRLMLQLPKYRKDTMDALEYGQVLAHHVENTDAGACAGRAFKKGRLVPYNARILESKDHFYELMEACRDMTGVAWEEMA